MTDQMPEGVASRDLYTIPSHSSWFQWDEIHDTERRCLREFFDWSSSSQNPRVYKEYRDFIINKYREDPSRRLTFTEIRKSLVGDVGALHKVFLFLDRWGLVNFSASDRLPAPAPPQLDDGGGGFPVVVEDGPPSGVKVVPFPSSGKSMSPQVPPSAEKSVGEEGGLGFRLPPLTSYSDVFGSLTGPVCSVCGERCVSGYYESKKGGFVNCSKCFENENCTESKSVDDFKSIDQKNHSGKDVDEWTDSETLSLLEAVLKGNNDWNLVADHVRRSRHDCIARLIQLPFGEHMLGPINGKFDDRNPISQRTDEPMQCASADLALEPKKTDTQQYTQKKEQIAEEENLGHSSKRRRFALLADASDSLMEQVAHLSTIAGPRVAAAAAEAAVSALCHENPYARKVFQIDTDECNSKSFSLLPNMKPERDQTFEDQETAEELKVSEISESNPEKNFGHLTFQIRAATATAFGAVAAHAKLLADQEDREMEHLMASVVELQLRKIKHKIKHFEDLESIMEAEYTHVQQMKESILTEWIGILQNAQSAGISRWRDLSFSKVSAG